MVDHVAVFCSLLFVLLHIGDLFNLKKGLQFLKNVVNGTAHVCELLF